MNFSLLPSEDYEMVTEEELQNQIGRTENFALVLENGWKVFFNTLYNSINFDETVSELRRALSTYQDIAEGRKTALKEYSHSSGKLDDIPALPDPENNTRYLSAGIAHATLEDVRNSSFHRVEVIDGKLGIFLGKGDLSRMLSECKQDELDVFITNPSMPEVAVASSLSAGYGIDELSIAESISRMEGNELLLNSKYGMVPVQSSFVMDCSISKEQVMVDEKFRTPGGIVKKEIPYNLLNFRRIMFDEKSAYGIVQGGPEHELLFRIAKSLNPNIRIEL